MYAANSEYDRGVNTFSPEGRLFQVEYAMESIKLGTTALGVLSPEGVVLCVENRMLSPLVVAESLGKVFEVDSHVGLAVSGLIGDGKLLLRHAQETAQQEQFKYNQPIRPRVLTRAVSDLALRFGEADSAGRDTRRLMSRPFGTALLVGGMCGAQPELYYAEPSGSFLHYRHKAVGAGAEVAETLLAAEYSPALSLEEAKRLAVRVLRRVMEQPLSSENVQVAAASAEEGFRILPPAEVARLLGTA